MTKDLALDLDTHDLYIDGINLRTVNGLDQVEQNLKIRLQFYSAEWFLNTTNGLPFYSDILVKNPNIENVDAVIKAEILATEGVNELLEFSSTFDNSARTYTIDFKVNTDFGQSDFSFSLFNAKT